MTEDTQVLPYKGIRVIDMSQGVAGPYSAMLMAQNGADVIKIEPGNGGDWSRILGHPYGDHTAYSIAANMGKRSIVMDLKKSGALDIIDKMIASADVFIEGFRPGVADRLGCSYDRLKEINPRLIYVSISGFGQSGPMRELPGTDQILQAFTGYMSDNRCDAGKPQRTTVIFFDMAAGLYAQQAIASTLFAQKVQGLSKGRKIDVSLLETAAAIQSIRLMNGYREGPFTPTAPPSGTFKTKDGWLQINIIKDDDFKALAKVLGHQEWAADDRFNSNPKRRANLDLLASKVSEVFANNTSTHWAALMTDAGLQNQSVQDYPTFAEHPQTKAIEAVSWLTQIGDDVPWPIANIPGMTRFEQDDALAAAPSLGQHSREVMTELGYNAAEIDTFVNEGAVTLAGSQTNVGGI
jgi:CoA:oxalate CoA-transferase